MEHRGVYLESWRWDIYLDTCRTRPGSRGSLWEPLWTCLSLPSSPPPWGWPVRRCASRAATRAASRTPVQRPLASVCDARNTTHVDTRQSLCCQLDSVLTARQHAYSMHSAILFYQFCPSVRAFVRLAVVLYLNECAYRQTFWPSGRSITLV